MQLPSIFRIIYRIISMISPILQFNALQIRINISRLTGSFFPIFAIVEAVIFVAAIKSFFIIPLSIKSFHNLL